MAYDESKYQSFLDHLAMTGIVTIACERAGISKEAVYRRCGSDDAFRREFERCRKAGARLNLVEQANDLAINGGRRVKFNPRTGQPYVDPETGEPYVEREYEPQLLMFLLRAADPETYGDSVRHEIGRKSDDDLIDLLAKDKETLLAIITRAVDLGTVQFDSGGATVCGRRVACPESQAPTPDSETADSD